MLIDVLVNIKTFGEKVFTYKSNEKVLIGSRVEVPLMKRSIIGIVIGYRKDCDYEVKEIIRVIDTKPILNEELIELGKYMRDTYLSSLVASYEAMLPKSLKLADSKINIKYVTYIKKIKNKDNPTKGEANILDLFCYEDLVVKSKVKNREILKRLINEGILEEVKCEVNRYNIDSTDSSLKVLTKEQSDAYNQIKNSKKDIVLLHGVTGSGKTEVYMHLISDTLKNGKNAIVLVPEISLTTQVISRFRSVFKDIAVLHSGLSDGERFDEYRKIAGNKVRLVIGTRSAIFAPLSNIGIIIIDEEHEDTYKQENNPRYNAIDIAIKRIKYHKCKLLLGSATPSLVDYSKAYVGRYELVNLLTRVNNIKLPKVEVVDMKLEIKNNHPIISRRADELIKDRLLKKEQIMILINRRGYSNYIICNECGSVIKCPNCDISLTYHKKTNTLKCHYCDYSTLKYDICPNCKSKYLVLKGSGTEKIEELLNTKYNARVVRMDRDTTSNKGMHESIINDFNDYKYDILLGTQMISKGLDFDNVTLVIVLSGDSSLNIPDYKSAERTFSLLTQVEGRAGRKKDGIAIIQTYNPDHYSIKYATNHDYINFYKKEIKIRKSLNYPPFTNIVAIRVLSKDYDLGFNDITRVGNYLKSKLSNNFVVLGPTYALKINNVYKFQLIVKYKDKENLYSVLCDIEKFIKNNKLEIDFNPVRL